MDTDRNYSIRIATMTWSRNNRTWIAKRFPLGLLLLLILLQTTRWMLIVENYAMLDVAALNREKERISKL